MKSLQYYTLLVGLLTMGLSPMGTARAEQENLATMTEGLAENPVAEAESALPQQPAVGGRLAKVLNQLAASSRHYWVCTECNSSGGFADEGTQTPVDYKVCSSCQAKKRRSAGNSSSGGSSSSAGRSSSGGGSSSGGAGGSTDNSAGRAQKQQHDRWVEKEREREAQRKRDRERREKRKFVEEAKKRREEAASQGGPKGHWGDTPKPKRPLTQAEMDQQTRKWYWDMFKDSITTIPIKPGIKDAIEIPQKVISKGIDAAGGLYEINMRALEQRPIAEDPMQNLGKPDPGQRWREYQKKSRERRSRFDKAREKRFPSPPQFKQGSPGGKPLSLQSGRSGSGSSSFKQW